MTPLASELESILQQVRAINAQAGQLVHGLADADLAWRAEPGRWSIAENLLHLEITTKAFLPSVDQAIERASRLGLRGDGPFRLGGLDRIFVWWVEPPPVIRLPAPKPLRPLLEGPASEVLPRFLQAQEMMIERVHAANGLHLIKATVVSPLARYVRMSLLGFFSVFTGHERRHLWQATKVRESR